MNFYNYLQEVITINQQPNNFDSIFNLVDSLSKTISQIQDQELKNGLLRLTKQYRDKLNLINNQFNSPEPELKLANEPKKQIIQKQISVPTKKQLPSNVLDTIFK